MMKILSNTFLFSTLLCWVVSSGCGDDAGNGSPASMNKEDNNTILGAGATFPYPLYSKMFSEYGKSGGLRVNYQSIGSGGGISQLSNKTVDFGASDMPLNEEQTAKMGSEALHIPVTLGAVVLSYNLPDLGDTLNLSGPLLADIFLGKINRWNDARIVAENPGVGLPASEIIVARRSDGSGTTSIFTGFLSKISPAWQAKVGQGSAVNWPVGLGGKGNEGVAGLVKQTPGAIGYIELAYAIQNNMSFARISNKSGRFIAPGVASTTAAANISLPSDGKVSLTNTDAPDGYPISGFSWIIIYKEQNYNSRSIEKAEKMLKLLWWMIHEGQQFSEPLHYAPLPPAAVAIGENLLRSATYNGKPVLK